jgi:hypothetical protein
MKTVKNITSRVRDLVWLLHKQGRSIKRIIKTVVLVAMVILSGCYSPKWYRANTTYAELKEDSNWCKSRTNIGSTREAMIAQYERCMKDKGYRLKGKDPYSDKPTVKSEQDTRPIIIPGSKRLFNWDFAVAYSGPGDNYPVIATFRKGDKLTILEQSGKWVKVRSENNQVGWIRSEVLK